MANYKESEITGTSYLRARLIEIHNQLGVMPHVAFMEELVTTVGAQVYHKDTRLLRVDYAQDTEIELLSPETQEPLGVTMTHAQVMVAIYSLYMKAAALRDAPAVAVVLPVAQGGVENV